MALIGGDKRLVAAHLDAVKTTMKWVESRLAEGRKGKDGHTTVQTGKPPAPFSPTTSVEQLTPN